MCAKVKSPVEVSLEFASNAQEVVGSRLNFMLGSQSMERLSTDRIRVSTLSGLKITMQLDEGEEREWRVSKVNGALLGRDEFIVLDRAILGDVSDPRFNLVRDPVFTKLQHLHRVELLSDDEDDDEANLEYDAGLNSWTEPIRSKTAEAANKPTTTSRVTEFGSRVKSLLTRIVSSLESQAPVVPLPYNLVINQTAVAPTGVGAAPLPATVVPAGARVGEFGPVDPSIFPWTTIFAAGIACNGPIPEEGPRDHQIIVIRRGGCSFSTKLANIPAYTQSPQSLQLVVIVSDDDEDGADYRAYALSATANGLVRPLLDEVQHTPGGIPRRHPIPMVMVGGGETAYRQLAMAERVGLARRYYIESQGSRVRNIIVDEGDAGVNL
jgi:hypothetical protein